MKDFKVDKELASNAAGGTIRKGLKKFIGIGSREILVDIF